MPLACSCRKLRRLNIQCVFRIWCASIDFILACCYYIAFPDIVAMDRTSLEYSERYPFTDILMLILIKIVLRVEAQMEQPPKLPRNYTREGCIIWSLGVLSRNHVSAIDCYVASIRYMLPRLANGVTNYQFIFNLPTYLFPSFSKLA